VANSEYVAAGGGYFRGGAGVVDCVWEEMMDVTINRVRIEVGQKYWISYATETIRVRVRSVIRQEGAFLIRWWRPMFLFGLIGYTVTETVEDFWKRMVKAS
jgi:hypothetical protein